MATDWKSRRTFFYASKDIASQWQAQVRVDPDSLAEHSQPSELPLPSVLNSGSFGGGPVMRVAERKTAQNEQAGGVRGKRRALFWDANVSEREEAGPI
ncbi:MAG: hypothetical protein RLY70_1247 [Planctomycetota bacterium]|jgi:hypothetical protein